MDWSDQYKHPKWQKKRLDALQRADFACENCGSEESQLQVHHKQYFKGRKIWEYDLSELSVLCAGCHEAQHKTLDGIKLALAKLNYYQLEIVQGYLDGLSIIANDGPHDDPDVEVVSAEYAMGLADVYRISDEAIIRSLDGKKIKQSVLWGMKKNGKN